MSGFNINQVSLGGNLTRDPELRQTKGGTDVASVRMAVNGRRKDAAGEWVDDPNYFNVTIWGGLGRIVSEQLSKGDKLAVAGRLNWHEWETDDGAKRQDVDVVADSVFFQGKGNGGGGSYHPDDSASAPPSGDVPASSSPPGDDIPF